MRVFEAVDLHACRHRLHEMSIFPERAPEADFAHGHAWTRRFGDDAGRNFPVIHIIPAEGGDSRMRREKPDRSGFSSIPGKPHGLH